MYISWIQDLRIKGKVNTPRVNSKEGLFSVFDFFLLLNLKRLTTKDILQANLVLLILRRRSFLFLIYEKMDLI